MAPVDVPGWSQAFSGTRRESSVDCIALLPRLISTESRGSRLRIASSVSGTLLISMGTPGYTNKPLKIKSPADTLISTDALLGIAGTKIVIELTDSEGILLDEKLSGMNRAGHGWCRR
jgi:hypothetical protein